MSSIPDRSRVQLPAPTLYQWVHTLVLRDPDISYEWMKTACSGYIIQRDQIGHAEYKAREPAIDAEIHEVQERVNKALAGHFAHADALAALDKAVGRTDPQRREVTSDGLIAALRDCGAFLRWNTRARRVEVQWVNLDAGWHVCAGAVLDSLMNKVSEVALMTRGAREVPWAAMNSQHERRLLIGAAQRRQEKGPGTFVYDAARAWDSTLGDVGKVLPITAVVGEVGALHHWESSLRTTADVYLDVSQALTDAGWKYHEEYEDEGRKRQAVWVRPGPRKGASMPTKR